MAGCPLAPSWERALTPGSNCTGGQELGRSALERMAAPERWWGRVILAIPYNSRFHNLISFTQL